MADKPMDDNALISYVDDMYSRANRARWMYLNQWYLCLHFYIGNQYVYWAGTPENGQWVAEPNIDGKIKFVSNKILPATRMLIGQMLQDQSQQLVIQASNDEKDIDAAKAATRFLDYEWRRLHGDTLYKEVCTWAAITGIGITKTYVDYDKGPKKKMSAYRDGEICQQVISPFEFVIPPNMRVMDKLPWAMHARMESKEWVQMKWPKVGDVNTVSSGDEWAIYQMAVQNITTEGTFFGSNAQFTGDTVLVKEMWIRPCKQYPNGRVIIVAGDKLVFNEDIPGDKDFWPFNAMAFIDAPYRFWPMGAVEPMIDTQKAINNLESRIQESIRYVGNPIVLLPMGAMEPDTAVAEPGAFWEFNPSFGMAPSIVSPTPVSPELFTERSSLQQDIYEMAGQHMMAGGIGGLRAAAAVMLFQQMDQTEFLAIKTNTEIFLKRDAEIKLQLAKDNFTVVRKMKILGEEGQWMVQEFDAATLNDDMEVEIQSKQEFANDKMTRFNQVLQLLGTRDESGKPMIDRETALRLLDMAGLDGATTEYDLDWNLANWENKQLLDKKEVTVNDFDDHAVHIRAHNMERKRISFRSLPKAVQDEFAQHVLDHQQMLQQQSSAQTQAKGDEQVSGTQPAMPQMQQPQQPSPFGMPGAVHMPNMYDGPMQLQQAVRGVHNSLP